MMRLGVKMWAAPCVAAVACWVAAPALGGQPEKVAKFAHDDGQIMPFMYAPIYADGTLGAWTPINQDPAEGTATCIGRGFDVYEPVLGSADPCAGTSLVCENGATITCAPSCAGRNANGAGEGGVNPFCVLGTDMPTCPVCSGRFGFTIGGSFIPYSVGSQASALNPPTYAVGQAICAIDFSLFVSYVPGSADNAGQTVGTTSYVDWVIHSAGAFPAADDCSPSQPLFGALVGTPGGTGGIPGGYRFAYTSPTVIGAIGSRFRFGPIDLSASVPPLTMPASGVYEVRFWNDMGGTIVSGNNQPALWSSKDPVLQGSSSASVYTNDDFSAVPDDTGGQYDPSLGECFITPNLSACATELGSGLRAHATVRLGVAMGIAGVVNDTCANGSPIPANGSTNGTTVGATNDGSASCGGAGAADVWYRFSTTACGGTLALSTCGTTDTVLSVYTSCGGAEVACNDNGAAGCTPGSSVTFAALPNTTYRIRVATVGGTGTFTLVSSFTIPAPANDLCANATAITGDPVGLDWSSCGSEGDGVASCTVSNSSIWYRYTAPCTGTATVETVGMSATPATDVGDTVLTVYDTTACPGAELACNDDIDTAGGIFRSRLTFAATGGTQYLIRISGFGTVAQQPPGTGRLTITLAPPATTVTIASASPANGLYDTLENTSTGLVLEGIGATVTPTVTFSSTPCVAPAPGNISTSCTGGTCPTVTAVAGVGAGPYTLTLSGQIPVLNCWTALFSGTAAGQKLQYRFGPGDVNLNATITGQDVLSEVSAINGGTTTLIRHDINRNGVVTGQDVLRLVQLLNGGVTVSPPAGYNGAVVAACP